MSEVVVDRKREVLIHFIYENKLYDVNTVHFVPRHGELLRFSNTEVFKVVKVLWAYDEPCHANTRVNIDLEKL